VNMMLLVNVIMQLYYSVHCLNTYEALAANRLLQQIPDSLYPSILNGLVELNLRSLEQQFGVNLRARPIDLRIRQRVPEGDNDPVIHEELEHLNEGRQQQEGQRDINAEDLQIAEQLINEQPGINMNIRALQVIAEEEKVEENEEEEKEEEEIENEEEDYEENEEEELSEEEYEEAKDLEEVKAEEEEVKAEEDEEEAKAEDENIDEEEMKDEEIRVAEVIEESNDAQLSDQNENNDMENFLHHDDDQFTEGIKSQIDTKSKNYEEIKSYLDKTNNDNSLRDPEHKDKNVQKSEAISDLCYPPEEEKIPPFKAPEKARANFDISFALHKSSPTNNENEYLSHMNESIGDKKERENQPKEEREVGDNEDGEDHNEDMEEKTDE